VALFHRGKAIRKVNEYLNDSSHANVNEVIGAVLGLATFEVTNRIIPQLDAQTDELVYDW
jgi:hypothetical protein